MLLYNYGVPTTKEELLEKVIDPGISELCSKLWERGIETRFSCSGLVSEHDNWVHWGHTYVLIPIRRLSDILFYLKMKFIFFSKIKLFRDFHGNKNFGYYAMDNKMLFQKFGCYDVLKLTKEELTMLDEEIKKNIKKFVDKI